MQIPSKKYIALPLVWICLCVIAVFWLKRPLPAPNATSSSLVTRKLMEKKNDTAIKKLNMSLPTTAMYQTFMDANINAQTPFQSPELVDYYQQLSEAMPWMAESYTLLGFCYYKQGDRAKAFDSFQKSFYLNPTYFYNNVSLSLMYLEAHQITQAVKLMQITLAEDPKQTLQFIATSKIYQDILGANPSYNVIASLQQDYAALAETLKRLESNPNISLQELTLHIRAL